MIGIKAFVAHSFNEADKELVRTFLDHFRALSKANPGFAWDHAEEAEATPLSEKVLAKIQDKNVFIGICTKSEYAIAQAALKPIIFSKRMLKTTVNDACLKC
jgi:phosphoglycolate phosphatase-like HAD superfamily hydrolase